MVYSLAMLCHRNHVVKQIRVFILKTGRVSKGIQPFPMSPFPEMKTQVPVDAVEHCPSPSKIISSLHFIKPLLPGVTNFIAGMSIAWTDKGVFKTIALKSIVSRSQIRYLLVSLSL